MEIKYLPEISLNLTQDTGAYSATLNRDGSMTNSYSPFQNLQDEHSNIGSFTTKLLNFDLEHPVDIVPQDSYDGSVNLILNDGKNQPRLIGSRFSVIDDGQFKITDHKGFKDTNIYDTKTFTIDTSLKSIAQKIPQIEYQGLTQYGGSLPCGAYTFYFKLSDADGNESEVIAESGIVQIFIEGLSNGMPDPKTIRMGLENENSGKSVTFKLTNLDSGFDYVHVLYARSSSGNEQASVDTYHKVIYDFPAFNGETLITITGKEQILDISANELYVDYADIEAVRTQTVVNNVLFFGNTIKKERDWNLLERESWKIRIGYGQESNVGMVSSDYICSSNGYTPEEQYSGCYYNTFNTYYRVGYWPDEIYQFGIVYIFNDNSLSPVFSLQGVDFSLTENSDFESSNSGMLKPELFFCEQKSTSGSISGYQEWENAPDNYYFKKNKRLNSKGVVKLPKISVIGSAGETYMRPKPLCVKFDLSYLGCKTLTKEHSSNWYNSNSNSAIEFFEQNDIKGYFIVRKTRIPTIIAQGLAIGLTDKDRGALPVLKTAGFYQTQSFLGTDRFLENNGLNINVNPNSVSVNAVLIPDAELSEATFNQIFVSNLFALSPAYSFTFRDDFDKNYHHTAAVKNILSQNSDVYTKRKLTVVQDSVKTLTDGEVYFSTQAGIAEEGYKTKDVYNIWTKTKPQDLTKSEYLVRGNWGPYVGVGNPQNEYEQVSIQYGKVYNIKTENYANADLTSVVDLEFQKRFSDVSSYKAICHRTQISKDTLQINCYRGDCFQSLFTHRMMRNFIDPELPTNDKIISPSCWAENYAVRSTATSAAGANWNIGKEQQGWWVSKMSDQDFHNEIASTFEIKEDPTDENIQWDPTSQNWKYVDGPKKGQTANFCPTDSAYNYIRDNKIQKVDPKEQETSGIGGILKNLFKSDRWALRGLNGINRADVNAVALGEWITFPICSSKNLALRDVDYSNASEQASFNRKRSFYPLSPKDAHCPLRDSNVINQATAISLPHKQYFAMPDVPFIKQEYFTRIINSLRDSASSITNEFKVMLENAYRDYTKIYGSITKILPVGSNMLVVFQHGLGILAISNSMSQAQDASQYLPLELNMVLSQDFGSMWKDSIIKTERGIYGVDTVAKIIWKVSPDGSNVELLSPMKVEKFLIDSIDLSEFNSRPYVGRVNVKTHYNAFKHDVMFTYYNDIPYNFAQPNVELVELDQSSGSGDEKITYYRYSESGESIRNFNIDTQGYLLDKNGVRLKSLTGDLEPGIKIEASYDSQSGKVITYADKVADKSANVMWAQGKSWSLCWNENLNAFVTFYDWIPLESENIDNIWFSFDREAANRLVNNPEAISSVVVKPYGVESNMQRDEKYGKYALDKAFNTYTGITYVKAHNDNSTDIPKLTFNLKQIRQVKDNIRGTVIGLYVKGLDDTDITYNFFNGTTNIYSETLPAGTTWKFIYIIINNINRNLDFQLQVTCSVETSTKNIYGAISDYIIKELLETDSNSESINRFCSTYINGNSTYYAGMPGETVIDDFYFVRDTEVNLKLWKHGQAGIYDNADYIKPTHWYGQQHEFNFEFIARKDVIHKIFTNLQLISNKAEPNKFEVEIVGEVYDWHNLKPVLKWIADQVEVSTEHVEYDKYLQKWYKYVLSTKYGDIITQNPTFPRIFGMKNDERFKKLPYMKVIDAQIPSLDPQVIGRKKGEKNNPSIYLTPEQQDRGMAHSDNTTTTALVYDRQLNEFRVHTEQLGNNIWKYGRLRGNMQYLEDLWRVELRPVAFKYAYIVDGQEDIQFTKIQETRPRDKYIKIKVRYSGEDLAVIQAVQTIFDYSYT